MYAVLGGSTLNSLDVVDEEKDSQVLKPTPKSSLKVPTGKVPRKVSIKKDDSDESINLSA